MPAICEVDHVSQIKYIVVHCSDTPNSRQVTAKDIHRSHSEPKPKGNGWSGIGYHEVIKRDGIIEHGRPYYWSGAHVRGHNYHSVGICLIGRDQFTESQMVTLKDLVSQMLKQYPEAQVVGHRDLDPHKTCPNFNVASWWEIVSL